jgi:hypothetical protein
MWVTQDGHELVLPRAGLDAVAAHLSGGAACAACATATRRKVAAMVARLVAGARRTPAVVRTPAGAPRQLFAARAGGRPYGIVTRPVGDRRHVITAVRPRPATSHEELRLPTVTKQITVTVDWRSHATLDAVASKFPFAGVYVVEVERDGKWVPIYVGKADTETVSRRWRGRLRVFRELDIPLPKGYRVWAAEVHRRVLVTHAAPAHEHRRRRVHPHPPAPRAGRGAAALRRRQPRAAERRRHARLERGGGAGGAAR